MKALKSMIALAAVAVVGVAMAQSTPPSASKDPATGAGQRSTQNTPMGTTGTPGGGATMSRSTNSGTTGSGTSMGAGTTAGSTGGAAPMASSTTSDTSATATTSSGKHKAKAKKAKHRKARVDRG
jgi:hypothetical protein